jgi:hypothetical protein
MRAFFSVIASNINSDYIITVYALQRALLRAPRFLFG